uniref:Proline rich membrane anchor 1 n=1 Tax=Poecilia formosa TaxID=48698 RepID=A0A096M4X9_POEFO
MRSTAGCEEEDDWGINYSRRRLSQLQPLKWKGWMVISQTLQAYVYYCIHLLETLPSIFENSAGGMLLRDLMPFTLSFWPFFIAHCLLSQLSLSCKGEIQRSCSRTVAEKVGEQCQVACHCRRYGSLPRTPHPEREGKILMSTLAEPMVPLLRPWWMEVDVIVLGTVSCASVVFLLSAIIICYK